MTLCEKPLLQPDIQYPICNLGDLEIHFLHYKSFEEAKQKWYSRTVRLNRDNIFIMWTFYEVTDESWLARFDKIPFANKVAFTEREFPQYKSAYCISGFEEEGVGLLTRYDNFLGRRVIDRFDYVSWFNQGKRKR